MSTEEIDKRLDRIEKSITNLVKLIEVVIESKQQMNRIEDHQNSLVTRLDSHSFRINVLEDDNKCCTIEKGLIWGLGASALFFFIMSILNINSSGY